MSSIEEWLKQHNIVEVECLVADMTGNARGKFMRVEKFNKDEARLPECVLLQTVTGEYCDEHDELVSPKDQDMILVADPNTARVIPWATKATAQIIHNCETTDGKPHPISSRNVLRRVLALYDDMGIKPVIAPEVEFYLVEKNNDHHTELLPPLGRSGRSESAGQSYGIEALYEFEPILDNLREYCALQELNIDAIVHESGTAQMEINFRHGDPLDLADQVFTFKRTMRQVAYSHGVYATFMAKPMSDEPGCSMHIHQSLVDKDSGENLFVNSDGEPTDTFMHYLGGLQKYTPNLISFYAPNVNSYRRLTKHLSAPINMHWGFDNRTVGLRIPDSEVAATRIENRFSGIDANPYLAIAASLASGLAGIIHKLKPDEAYEGNACDEEITIARSLEEALDGLDDLGDVADILGQEFITAYQMVKYNESEEFNRVISTWERENLLLNV